MKAGKIKVLNVYLHQLLNFPPDWYIENIEMDTEREGISIMTISGSDFPECEDGQDPKECRLTVHKENIRFEVKEIEKTV